jgi:hypothetical protein
MEEDVDHYLAVKFRVLELFQDVGRQENGLNSFEDGSAIDLNGLFIYFTYVYSFEGKV